MDSMLTFLLLNFVCYLTLLSLNYDLHSHIYNMVAVHLFGIVFNDIFILYNIWIIIRLIFFTINLLNIVLLFLEFVNFYLSNRFIRSIFYYMFSYPLILLFLYEIFMIIYKISLFSKKNNLFIYKNHVLLR